MQFVPLIIAAAGAAASIGIQAQGMKQTAQAGKSQRDVLRAQQDMFERDQLADLARAKAKARAETSASGVDVFFGSPLDVLGALEVQAYQNVSRLELDFDNRVAASKAESDSLRLASVGNILGSATQPLQYFPTFDTNR